MSHQLLNEQLRKIFSGDIPDEEQFQSLLKLISEAYEKYDQDLSAAETSFENCRVEKFQIDAELTSIIEAFSELIIVIDRNDQVLEIKGEYQGFFDFPEEWKNVNIRDYVPKDYQNHLANAFKVARKTLKIQDLNLSREINGSNLYFELRLIAQADQKIFILVRDRTERRREESKIFRNQKLESIGTLTAGIAHEINTPMQYIESNLSFILSEVGKVFSYIKDLEEKLDVHNIDHSNAEYEYLSAEIPNAISDTLSGVQSICKIINTLRDFSYPFTSEFTNFNLKQVIENVLTLSRNEWKTVADIELNLEPPDIEVYSSLSELSQCLLNLIVNAAHAINAKGQAEKGKIVIKTEVDRARVNIMVEDNGVGIDPTIENKIFDPFFTTKPVGKGTGQGLTISRRIVNEVLKGEIEFRSQFGVGTTFIISLPNGITQAMEGVTR